MADQRNKVKNFSNSIIGIGNLPVFNAALSSNAEVREFTVEEGSSQASVVSYHDSSFSDVSVSCDVVDEKACAVNRPIANQQRGSLFSSMFRAQINPNVCSMFAAFNNLQ